MKKFITVLVVMAMMAAGAPLAVAADGQMKGEAAKEPVPESMTREMPTAPTGPGATAIVAVGAALAGVVALAASSDGGGTTPSHHTPPSHNQ